MHPILQESDSRAVPRPKADLLSRLLDLARDERPPPCIRVRAKNAHTLSALDVDTPLLAMPLEGSKRVREKGAWIDIAPGEMLLVPHPIAFDVENIPDPRTGLYVAIGIPLEDHVLNAARHLVRNPVLVKGDGGLSCVPLAPHLDDLTNWLDALNRGDLARACHSVAGMVLSLYAQGHRTLLYPPAPTLSVRIRKMVETDPTREWSSSGIETELGVSGATLRRHLAAEGISLRAIVSNSRLSHALMLLLTTRLPVKSIAVRAGYASISSFVKRFRTRYGVEPSAIGGLGGI